MPKKTQILTIAAAKGYLLENALDLLRLAGYRFNDDILTSRKLFAFDETKTIKLLQIRPWDVTAYVEKGAADLGVVGMDVLHEKNENVATLLDLGFGHCRLVIAGLKNQSPESLPHHIRVATKYPYSADLYFRQRGIKAEIIKLYGAVELAPLTGLADVICDLTASGKTLAEHGLVEIDTILSSTAHLIANPIGLRVHYQKIKELTEILGRLVTEKNVVTPR